MRKVGRDRDAKIALGVRVVRELERTDPARVVAALKALEMLVRRANQKN